MSTALLWQPLWILAQPGLWPHQQPGPAAAAALGGVGVAWVLLVAAHLSGRRVTPAVRLSVAMLVVAALTINAAQLRSDVPDIPIAAEMAGLAAGIAGLLLSWRWGVLWTAIMVVPLTRDALSVAGAGPQFPVLSAYVLAIGLSAVAVRHALLRNAAAADRAADDLYLTERQQHMADQVERALHSTERRLHETVLNTLVAIGRGGISTGTGEAGIRTRSADSARVLATLRGRSEPGEARWLTGDLAGDVASVVEELHERGVSVEWDATSLEDLPRNVYSALRSGVAEALLNVGRHAGAHRVLIRSSIVRRGREMAVQVEVADDGRGFDTAATGSRFGIAEAILSPMVEVGGTATVVSTPGVGTRVRLEWRQTDRGLEESAVSPAALSVPLLATAGLYVLSIVVVTWSTLARPGMNTLALLAYVVGVAGVIGWTLKARLPWVMVVAVAALGGATYAFQTDAAGPQTTPEWSSSAVAVLFMVVAATGPRWSWLVLVGVWLVIQGDPLHELTQPGTALILVGALLGRSIRRNAALAGQRREEHQEADARRESTRVRLHRLGHRYAALTASQAPELLQGLADGALSPHAAEVRERAVREERFIRNVLAVDPRIDALHAVVASLALSAHERGVLLDTDLAASSPHGAALPVDFVESCRWAVAHAAPTEIVGGQPIGTTARISSRMEGNEVMVRLLIPLAPGYDVQRASQSGALVDPEDEAGPVLLWETSLRPATPVAEEVA